MVQNFEGVECSFRNAAGCDEAEAAAEYAIKNPSFFKESIGEVQ